MRPRLTRSACEAHASSRVMRSPRHFMLAVHGYQSDWAETTASCGSSPKRLAWRASRGGPANFIGEDGAVSSREL